MNTKQHAGNMFVRIAFLLCLLVSSAFAEDAIQIYAPPTPSSIPFILAAQQMDDIDITIFADHSQAHTLFLRGDVPMLVTGLSVGINFFKQGVPVQLVNSSVSGLTYLITKGKQVSSFKELAGEDIYLPFEGSPIEEITKFLAEKEGVVWGKELMPKYAPFPSALELLKAGKISVIALPEPSATVAAAQKDVFVSFGYQEKWDALTGSSGGYPQVGMFVKKEWAEQHRELLAKLHQNLQASIQRVQEHPEEVVAASKDYFQFPEKVLIASLKRTTFALKINADLQQDVSGYYQTIGQPLDDSFQSFFYRDPQ
ncbi:SsuA protein [Candidatus Moduliflexus flocculans]|uniref:SsuA protein n=1 Tax=Candidatus Moduliflexus flocculans TaxID=1499966 RepID=A0A0S6VRK6_9BACT|nr:SsuA protein [Candidatus Moduliflexus flocculans]